MYLSLVFLEAMWAARSLKFNGLALQKMMKTKFKDEGLEAIADNFKYRNLTGDILLLRDVGAWDLLNIPVDTAIDLFDSIRHCIDNSGQYRENSGIGSRLLDSSYDLK